MDEADDVARTIRRMVRDEGLRYREIAVVTGDLSGYRHILEKAFEAMEIPCFIDVKRSILNNAFVESIRALLEMLAENFNYEGVFQMCIRDRYNVCYQCCQRYDYTLRCPTFHFHHQIVALGDTGEQIRYANGTKV